MLRPALAVLRGTVEAGSRVGNGADGLASLVRRGPPGTPITRIAAHLKCGAATVQQKLRMQSQQRGRLAAVLFIVVQQPIAHASP
ncbi:hypothetical protein SVAN01_02377 [Stagonosporopsis vannaccii]|nr:hypothetical protein SVAN01_02377 [Stagonosporopsis vannaccii]